MFEGVPTRRIQFEYLDGLEIDFRPAVLDLNPLFVAASVAWIQPLTLAAQLPEDHPRHLGEERANRAMAKAYSMSVMVGSSTSDELDGFTAAEWEAWLLEHPEEFASIRSVAEIRTNFVDETEDEIGDRIVAQVGL